MRMPLFSFPLLATLACATTIEEIPKPAAPRAECKEGPATAEARHPAAFQVIVDTDTGKGVESRVASGVLIGRNGLMITSLAAIKDARRIVARFTKDDGETRTSFEVIVERRDEEKGVALLVPRLPSNAAWLPAPLPVQPKPGIYSDGDGIRVTASDGSWASARVSYPWSTWDGIEPVVEIQADDAVLGAPVVNGCGELIGIVVGTSPPHGVAFVLMLDDAFKALKIKPASK